MVISVTGDIFPWMFWLAIVPFILFCCAMTAASDETQEWHDKHPNPKEGESPPFTATDKWSMVLLGVWVLFWLPQVLHWTIPFFMHLRLVW